LLALGMAVSPESPRWLFQVCAVQFFFTIYHSQVPKQHIKINFV
jgi:hypothetical protein